MIRGGTIGGSFFSAHFPISGVQHSGHLLLLGALEMEMTSYETEAPAKYMSGTLFFEVSTPFPRILADHHGISRGVEPVGRTPTGNDATLAATTSCNLTKQCVFLKCSLDGNA